MHVSEWEGITVAGTHLKFPQASLGWRIFFSGGWFQPVASNARPKTSGATKVSQSGHEGLLPMPIEALTAALNAEKGLRARAVHLVIVEQTLRQGVRGGLNAVPIEVLAKAIRQLARLSLFRRSLELRRLFQAMRQIIENQKLGQGFEGIGSGAEDHEVIEIPDCGIDRERPSAHLRRPEAATRHQSQPKSHGDAADDFPDTEAFDAHEARALPLSTIDRGRVVEAGGLRR